MWRSENRAFVRRSAAAADADAFGAKESRGRLPSGSDYDEDTIADGVDTGEEPNDGDRVCISFLKLRLSLR